MGGRDMYDDNNGQLGKVLVFYSTSACKKERVLASPLGSKISSKSGKRRCYFLLMVTNAIFVYMLTC